MSMHVERRVLINTAVLGTGEVVGQLANFAFVVLLARTYGVEIFGWYSFAMALGAVLSVFVSVGGTGYVTRELAREPVRAQAIFEALRSVQVWSGLVVWLLIALTAVLSGVEPREGFVIVIVGAYHVLLRMAALFLAPTTARQRPLASAVAGGGHRILVAVLAAIAIVLGLDAPTTLLAMPFAALLALLAARAHSGPEMAGGAAIEPVNRATVIRASLPFLGAALLAVVYSRGGLLLLTAMKGEIATGLFAVADRLLVPIYMVTAVLATALLPALAMLEADRARMRELARRCLRLVLLASVPLCAMLAIFSTEIVTLLFGPELRPAATTLAMLAPLPVLRSITSLWSTQCIAIRDERRVALAKTRATVAFFILAAIGIGLAGATGLAIACVASEAYLALGLRAMLAGHSLYEPTWRVALGPVIAALAAAAVATTVTTMALPLRLLLVVGVMAVVLLLLGGVRLHDLRFLDRIMRGDATPDPARRTISRIGE
ncbi:MAG: oligosaccharide flippase family protein [Proteobacteria bacterium]|nr:oligosaccharide flippase family protein [Pseudomonadota bacterium]